MIYPEIEKHLPFADEMSAESPVIAGQALPGVVRFMPDPALRGQDEEMKPAGLIELAVIVSNTEENEAFWRAHTAISNAAGDEWGTPLPLQHAGLNGAGVKRLHYRQANFSYAKFPRVHSMYFTPAA